MLKFVKVYNGGLIPEENRPSNSNSGQKHGHYNLQEVNFGCIKITLPYRKKIFNLNFAISLMANSLNLNSAESLKMGYITEFQKLEFANI